MTQTITVATMSANAAGVLVAGEIRREGRGFVVYVRGGARSRASNLGGAAHQLASALTRELPAGRHSDWGVAVDCLVTVGVGLRYGNARTGFGGGGGGEVNPCVARAQIEYQRGDDNLHRALESAAKLLANCCG